MSKRYKRRRIWGPLSPNDLVLYRNAWWRVVHVRELTERVPPGHAPVKLENEEEQSQIGIIMVPIDDLM